MKKNRRFKCYGPTDADREAVQKREYHMDPRRFPKEVIGPPIINVAALRKNVNNSGDKA